MMHIYRHLREHESVFDGLMLKLKLKWQNYFVKQKNSQSYERQARNREKERASILNRIVTIKLPKKKYQRNRNSEEEKRFVCVIYLKI